MEIVGTKRANGSIRMFSWKSTRSWYAETKTYVMILNRPYFLLIYFSCFFFSDVSIWLHQAIKGMHDTYGAPVAAAHIIILLHRLCKLLFYKIKPVFVFDGGVPALKHSTMVRIKKKNFIIFF